MSLRFLYDFYSKIGAREGGVRRCLTAVNSTFCIYPTYRQVLPAPSVFHRGDAKLQFPLFCTQYTRSTEPSDLMSSGSDSMAKLGAATP